MQRFTVPTSGIVAESFDEQIVAIDLKRGTYYSLEGTASFVWDLLKQGASLEELVDAVQDRFTEVPAEVPQELELLLQQLEDENLIVPSESSGSPVADSPKTRIFVTPVLSVHTDVQQFLLIDPIHDVASSGWPEKKT